MSNQEFENYIALIGKLLQLTNQQREQIAGELQDHLQMRVADLIGEGVEKQDAIGRALEEFGDAAVMAKNFQSVINHKKRRRMMRFITFSIAGSFVTAVLLMAMWPSESRFGAPNQSIAQDVASEEKVKLPVDELPLLFSPGTERTLKTEQVLKQNVSLQYYERPFGEVKTDLEELSGLNFILNQSASDDSLTTDEPISFILNDVPLNKALSLMLEAVNATYIIDDGIVVIISLDDTKDDARWFRLKMYDCRELVEALPKTRAAGWDAIHGNYFIGGGGQGGGGGGGFFSIPQGGLPVPTQSVSGESQPAKKDPNVSTLLDQKLAKILSVMKADLEKNRPEPNSEQTLLNLVQSMVGPDSWENTGQGLGAVDVVNGILIVAQTEQIHQQTEKFLADLEVSVLGRTRKVTATGAKIGSGKEGTASQIAKARGDKSVNKPPAKSDTDSGDDPFGLQQTKDDDSSDPFN